MLKILIVLMFPVALWFTLALIMRLIEGVVNRHDIPPVNGAVAILAWSIIFGLFMYLP